MKIRLHIGLILLLMALLVSCNRGDPSIVSGYTNDLCFQNAMNAGLIYKLDGKLWLRAGEKEEGRDFDISGWALRPCQLNLGFGREFYPALIEPAYDTVSGHTDDYKPDERVIVLHSETGDKVYPLDLLNNHVLINEVADGTPVMVTYSILSDMPAVYRRNYCDTTFTFAVSGYSYWDYDIQNATNEFLLWDRETESLWWPMIKKAVSGQMQGMWLVTYNDTRWHVITWEEVVNLYPDALLLAADQTMEPPTDWPHYFEVKCK